MGNVNTYGDNVTYAGDFTYRGVVMGPCNLGSVIMITEHIITDQIANCRNRPLSANQDLKKNYTVFRENYTVSRERSLQKLAVLCN